MFEDSVFLKSEEDYDSFIKSLEGYNYYKCSFESPREYPALLDYRYESCPDSRDMIYTGEFSYPEVEIREEAQKIARFIQYLEDEFDFRLQEETTKLTSDCREFSNVDYSRVVKIAEDWLRKNG